MRRALLLATALLVAAGCGPADGEREVEGGDEREVEVAGGDERPVCLEGGPFTADGTVEVGGSSPAPARPADADRIETFRWESHDGCERLVLDLVDADGEPAERPGEVKAEVRRDLGVVRVTLEDVEWVAPEAADATFEGPLAGAAFSVFAPEGRWVYVDVHLRNPAEASVLVLEGPARVAVDLRPGGGAVPEPASRGPRVVVLEPRPGEAAYPLTVTGYARTFEANVVVRLEQDGEDVHEDFTTATAWADAWGHYAFTIEDGPAGPVVLHVGEYSARDGTWQGVAVPLEVR